MSQLLQHLRLDRNANSAVSVCVCGCSWFAADLNVLDSRFARIRDECWLRQKDDGARDRMVPPSCSRFQICFGMRAIVAAP